MPKPTAAQRIKELMEEITRLNARIAESTDRNAELVNKNAKLASDLTKLGQEADKYWRTKKKLEVSLSEAYIVIRDQAATMALIASKF